MNSVLMPTTILAFDPGTAIIGWAVLRASGDRLTLSDCDAIRTQKEHLPEARLKSIHDETVQLIKVWKPDVVAMERLFFARNQTTALKVGQAIGVIMLAAAEAGIPIAEYTPPEIKLAVVGEGNADKKQVQYMVARLLGLKAAPKPDDVADAVAIAICHAHSRRLKSY